MTFLLCMFGESLRLHFAIECAHKLAPPSSSPFYLPPPPPPPPPPEEPPFPCLRRGINRNGSEEERGSCGRRKKVLSHDSYFPSPLLSIYTTVIRLHASCEGGSQTHKKSVGLVEIRQTFLYKICRGNHMER